MFGDVIYKNYKQEKYIYFLIHCVFALLIIVADQVTKIISNEITKPIILKTAGIHKSVQINEFLNITHVMNRGISFGMFKDSSWNSMIFTIVTCIISMILFYLLYKNRNNRVAVAYSITLAGAIGNLIDRIKLGAVIDFIDTHIGSYHWPSFNIADVAICIGISLLLILESKQHYSNIFSNNKSLL